MLSVALLVGLYGAGSTLGAASTLGGQPAAPRAECAGLQTLDAGGSLAQLVANSETSEQWIRLSLDAGSRYTLSVDEPQGLVLALYGSCEPTGEAVALAGGSLEFTAVTGQDLYLLMRHPGVSSAGTATYQVSLAPSAPARPSLTAVAAVPEAVQRRANEFMKELVGNDLAPEWQNARINPTARILYRPDIEEPAYYEFTVEKPAEQGYKPAGFIQLAAGLHDYPVTRWDTTGMSPTQELTEVAPLGARVTQFYRLDPISYVAEYEQVTPLGITTAAAENILNIGDLPAKVAGLDAIPEKAAELVTESVDSTGKATYEGPAQLPLLETSGWESWAALKAGYEAAYAPQLRSLHQRAGAEWELANNLAQNGESLLKGDVRAVYGLPTQTIAQVAVTGPGAAAQYLTQEQLSEQGQVKGVRLTVVGEPADKATRLPFEVALTYSGGLTETLKFGIINSALAQTNRVFLPLVVRGGSAPAAVTAAAGSGTTTPGGVASTSTSWTYWWAEGDMGSIRYGQIPPRSGLNTSACHSGCGATAWAMIFGWTDRRVGHPVWGSHWGLYRVNGGLGADAVAPLAQDAGVNAMSWELRGHLGTYCTASGGATRVTDMIKAANYVRPRATASWRMTTRYDPTGLCWFGACNPARDLAREAITVRRQPVILAANNHYPVAHGFAEYKKRSCFLFVCTTSYTRWFWVNNGWYGSGNDWVKADDVFFAGAYYGN